MGAIRVHAHVFLTGYILRTLSILDNLLRIFICTFFIHGLAYSVTKCTIFMVILFFLSMSLFSFDNVHVPLCDCWYSLFYYLSIRAIMEGLSVNPNINDITLDLSANEVKSNNHDLYIISWQCSCLFVRKFA